MIFTTTLLGLGAVALAGGCAIASSWESENEEEEEELERMRQKRDRILRLRRSQLAKNRRKNAIKLELVAREKELNLVKRAAKLAERHLACGVRELEQFKKELAVINKSSVRLPDACVNVLLKELVGRRNDLKAVCSKSRRHLKEVSDRIAELNSRRFFFRCVSCRRKFSVPYGGLEKFKKSREGMRKCCDKCYLKMRKRLLAKRGYEGKRKGVSKICRVISK